MAIIDTYKTCTTMAFPLKQCEMGQPTSLGECIKKIQNLQAVMTQEQQIGEGKGLHRELALRVKEIEGNLETLKGELISFRSVQRVQREHNIKNLQKELRHMEETIEGKKFVDNEDLNEQIHEILNENGGMLKQVLLEKGLVSLSRRQLLDGKYTTPGKQEESQGKKQKLEASIEIFWKNWKPYTYFKKHERKTVGQGGYKVVEERIPGKEKIPHMVVLKVLKNSSVTKDFMLSGVRRVKNIQSLHLIRYGIQYSRTLWMRKNNYSSEKVLAPKLYDIKGKELRDPNMLQKVNQLHSCEKWKLLHQVAKGLKDLHHPDVEKYPKAKPCAHLDIKPANVILYTYGGQLLAKLSDYDTVELVLLEGNDIPKIGTLLYKAPEILKNVQQRTKMDLRKADIYSLALLMLEVTTGNRPDFDGSNLKIRIDIRNKKMEFNYDKVKISQTHPQFRDILVIGNKNQREQVIKERQTNHLELQGEEFRERLSYELLMDMFNPDPQLRPDMIEVGQRLRRIQNIF